MTLLELERYRKIKQNQIDAMEMLRELHSRALPASPALDGMPHGSGTSDKVGVLAIMIADLEAKIPEYEHQMATDGYAVEKFIGNIDDNITRMIFRLRFQGAKSWKEVADIMGKYYSEASVKSRCYRYLQLDDDGWIDGGKDQNEKDNNDLRQMPEADS